ncbi:hypothetical protein ISS07_04195, partial [Candidatus Woesearchaeota archaeon]|nr:hypothetical protein [Candidatus Woesearchaeota archaeon]
SFKSLFNEFMEKSLRSLISVVAEQSDYIASWIKNISGLRRMVKNLAITLSFFIAGLVIFGMAIAMYLPSYINVSQEAAYLIVGITFLLTSLIYHNLK